MSEEARSDRLAEALERALSIRVPAVTRRLGAHDLLQMLEISEICRAVVQGAARERSHEEAAMSTTRSAAHGRGIRSVTAYLAVRPPRAHRVREAGLRRRSSCGRPARRRHARRSPDRDTKVMIGAAAPGAARRHPRRFISMCRCGRVYQAALEAGAVSLRSPVDQPYGDRGSVRDLAAITGISRRTGGEPRPGAHRRDALPAPRGGPS